MEIDNALPRMKITSPLPKSIKDNFQNLIQKTDEQILRLSSYIIYSATYTDGGQPCTILLFNHNSEIYKTNRDLALNLYLQELFYLCARFGEYSGRHHLKYIQDDGNLQNYCRPSSGVFLDFKSFAVEGDKIAFAMNGAYSLKDLQSKSQDGQKNFMVGIPKMIEDMYASIKYINTRFGVSNIDVSPESIFAITNQNLEDSRSKGKIEYYITNWMSGARTEINYDSVMGLSGLQRIKRIIEIQKDGNDPRKKFAAPEVLNGLSLKKDTAAEIYGLGLTSLEIIGIEHETWKVLATVENAGIYNVVLSKSYIGSNSIAKYSNKTNKTTKI